MMDLPKRENGRVYFSNLGMRGHNNVDKPALKDPYRPILFKDGFLSVRE